MIGTWYRRMVLQHPRSKVSESEQSNREEKEKKKTFLDYYQTRFTHRYIFINFFSW
jgi:hypothetical protein